VSKEQIFKKEFEKSQLIEKVFRDHPKFPFLDFGKSITDKVLLRLFWEEMIRPYANYVGGIWNNYSMNYYESFREDDNIHMDVVLNCFNKTSKQYLNFWSYGKTDKTDFPELEISSGIDTFLAEVSENKDDELYFLGVGVNLKNKNVMPVVRDFLHSFLIERISLEKMQEKITKFDSYEGKKYLKVEEDSKNIKRNRGFRM